MESIQTFASQTGQCKCTLVEISLPITQNDFIKKPYTKVRYLLDFIQLYFVLIPPTAISAQRAL